MVTNVQNGSNVDIGVDVGGTKILCAAFNDDAEQLCGTTLPTMIDGSTVLSQVKRAIDHVLAELDSHYTLRSIGIGTPGIVDYENGEVSGAVSLGGGVIPFGHELSNRYHIAVVVDNDVNAAALGAYRLYGNNCERFAVLNVGTGVAAGFITQGKLDRGSKGVIGEIGHIPLEPLDVQAPLCHCGQQGCLELYISGGALSKVWGNTASSPIGNLWNRADSGDESAQNYRERYLSALIQALQMICVTYDPERIVLTGGVMRFARPLQEALHHEISQKERHSEFMKTIDISSRLFFDSQSTSVGALGASCLFEYRSTREEEASETVGQRN